MKKVRRWANYIIIYQVYYIKAFSFEVTFGIPKFKLLQPLMSSKEYIFWSLKAIFHLIYHFFSNFTWKMEVS